MIFCFFLPEESCSQVTSKRRAGPGKEIITKHDAQICSKKNAENVERVRVL